MSDSSKDLDLFRRFLSTDPDLENPCGDTTFGAIAVREGFITPAQLQEALASRNGKSLDAVLRDKGFLSEQQVRVILEIRRILTVATETGAGKTPDNFPAALREQRRIGRYRLLNVLGEGGMGVVFRAHDEELNRDVALKMLRTVQSYSPTQLERFQREMRNAARLSHPGIVTVYEVGREGDVLYYTMELVPGASFDPHLGDLRTRVTVLEKVARAVQYAHEQGVIHRDIKPQNIITDAGGAPRLLDFGISRDLQAPTELTRTGGLLGTPTYMAPEQAKGKVHEPDVRADVYALGAILYEVLAGQVPFTGETVADIVKRLLVEDPKPPPGPAELVAICLKALEKEPARRYPTAAAFADDLSRFLSGETVHARPPNTLEMARRRIKRHRTPILWLAGASLACVGAVALYSWLRPAPVRGVPTGAALVEVEGDVHLVSDGSRSPARREAILEIGQALELGSAGSRAVVRFGELSQMDLGEQTKVRLVSDDRLTARLGVTRRVILDRGFLVAKLSSGNGEPTWRMATPVVEVEAFEANCAIEATPWLVEIHVRMGSVRLSFKEHGASVDVGEGQYALVAPGAAPQIRAIELTVNFGPSSPNVVLPPKVRNDSGSEFNLERGFGWLGPKSLRHTKFRKGVDLDPLRATHIWGGSRDRTETWKILVPKGRYRFTVCVGDVEPKGPHHVKVQGRQVIDTEMTKAGIFLERKDVPVRVTDGELTMVVGGHGSDKTDPDGDSFTTLNYIIVKRDLLHRE